MGLFRLLGIDEGTSSISVGQIPPMPSEVGMLWFSTNEEELTLFIYVDDERLGACCTASQPGWHQYNHHGN